MKFLIVFALALSTASAYRMANSKLGIFNGKKAEAGQFPYQVGVSLELDNHLSWCGGSLIGKEWVLTAAHCTDNIISVTVHLGATERENAEIQYKVRPSKILDARFDRKAFKNDISLIRIPKTNYTPKIKRVKLPAISSSYSNYVGDKAIGTGWGYISDSNNDLVKDLQWGTMEITTNDDCVRQYGFKINPTNLCVSTTASASACQADSGGPLVLESSSVQVGVTSFGDPASCTKGYPVAYTRITSYLDWIKDKTGIYY